MSSSILSEPPTRGKIVIHTNKGSIDVELWAKETPKTTRNFIQLALDGYYDKSIFHRLVPDFILQGGDPTGTGHGGESATGDRIPIETHQRLRFNRRGLLGMADGQSQFFFTLTKTPELDGKHTLFGRIVGNTLYNLIDMATVSIDDNERPIHPVTITHIDVLNNPFDDIVPRADIAARVINSRIDSTTLPPQPNDIAKKPTKRSLALLSFANEELDDHEFFTKKKKKKLTPSSTTTTSITNIVSESPVPSSKHSPLSDKSVASSVQKQSPKPTISSSSGLPSTDLVDSIKSDSSNNVDNKIQIHVKKESTSPITSSNSNLLPKKENKTTSLTESSNTTDSSSSNKKNSKNIVIQWKLERDKYITKSKKCKTSEQELLTKLNNFRNKLTSVSSTSKLSSPTKKNDNNKDMEENYNDKIKSESIQLKDEKSNNTNNNPNTNTKLSCILHSVIGCLSCTPSFGMGLNDISDDGWMSHALQFPKDNMGKDVTRGRDLDDDMYMVIDPRDELVKEKKLRQHHSSSVHPSHHREHRVHGNK